MEQGALRFRAPKGALTPELRALVQARSAEIVAHLSGAAEPAGQITAVDRGAAPRMSFGQERIWFLHRLEGPSSTYNITPVFRLRGPLSRPALQHAFDALVRRHEPLRTRCSEVDGLGVQIVDPPAAVPISVVSLRDVAPGERLAAAERLILAETARPFDLEREWPLRVTLIELDDADRILLPFMHHIAADGWSLGVLQQEFNVLYHAAVTGAAPQLPPLPVQYADFAAWQRSIQQGERGRAGLDYWRRQLAGAPQTLALPLDFERPPSLTSSGQVLHLAIPEELANAIAARARAEGSSLFMILLAAYAVLLHRYSGQEDLLIGSPVAGRPRRELEALIGCFVNTLVLRVRVTGTASFTDLLRQVRQTALDAYSWQDVPVEAVIDAVIEQRDPSRIPLYQAQFSLQNVPVRASAVSSLQVEQMPMDRVAAKNDLSFILERRDGAGIAAEVEFNTDLFREETLRGMWDDYVQILEHVAAAPETAVSALRMRSVAALAPAALVANEGPQNLVGWFESIAAAHPARTAVADSRGELSYAQLDRRSTHIAAALLAHALEPQGPVGVLISRSVNLPAAIIGVLKAGAAYVPLSIDHPADRLRFMLSHAGVRLLLVDETTEAAARALVDDTEVTLVVIDASVSDTGSSAIARRRPVAPDDLAYVIFTSGSTGRPKGVMIEHGSVVNLVHALRDLVYADLPDALNVALVASPVFDASVQQIFATLLLGHTLHIVPDELRRDGEALCRWFRGRRIQVSDGTPSLLGLMLRGGLVEQCGETLRHLLIGGEPLPAELLRTLHHDAAGRGIVVTNVYGPTECCVDVVALRVTADDNVAGAVVPIGMPMRNCQAVVVDRHGRTLPPGVPGELVIGGVCVGRGYVNDAALTADRFQALPRAGLPRAYRTGDICRQTRQGVIEFLGRNDDQVKILGHRIELGEVESHLRAHSAIVDVSVQARLTSKGYREMAAYIATRAAVSVADLREFAAARMPAYMIPAYFVPLDALPLNESGKVARDRLPDPETARLLPSGTEYVAPAGAAEEALLQVWTRTLKLERAGVRDNYFASGGDSIKALQLASRLRDAGWKVEIRDIFKYPTIEQLSPHLTRWGGAADDGKPDTGVSPLSATQRFFFETYGAGATFNQAILLRPLKPIGVERLRTALLALMAQHAMLRSRFTRQQDEWVQETLAPAAVQPRLLTHETPAAQSFELGEAPLWSAALYDAADGQRLLLTAHHLIVDGVSWRILLDDLQLVLGQLERAETPALPARSAPYSAWVSHQRNAVSTSLVRERDYWRAGTAAAAPPGGGRQADRRELRAALTGELTRALLTDAHEAYGTEINDLLITAAARAWHEWTGDDRCGLTIEGHGREALDGDIDTTRTIGWFTSIFPVTIQVPPADGEGAVIEAVKATLRAIPRKGAGYTVLRYLGVEADRGLAPLPPLAFNYLGRFDSAGEEWFERAPEAPPPTATPDVAMPWPLEITAAVVSGRLEIGLAYSQASYQAAEVERFLNCFQSEIAAIVRHTLAHGASAVQESLPLTPLQDGMYFHALSEPGSEAYFEQWSFRLEGELQPDIVRDSWNDLFARHDALRTAFTSDAAGRPQQQVLRRREVELTVKDLSALPPSARAARLDQEKANDRRRGFVLDADPLVRVLLIRWAADQWDLIWSHHHIVLDGWSAGLVQFEFLETYAARRAGRPATLEPAPAFGDFVRTLPAATDLSFWSNYLGGYDTTAELPRTAQPGPAELGRHLVELSPETSLAIAAFCRSEGVTLSAFVQAVWGVILSRYAYSDDVVFGYVVSGRPPSLPGVERMVGLLINTIPVRVRLREDESFSALVRRLLAEAADLTAHQHTPLVEAQRASGASAPLVNHVVALENYPIEEGLRAFGRRELGFDITSATSYDRTNYGFDLVVLPGTDALRFRLSWDRSQHADALMTRIGEQLKHVIATAVAHPEHSPCRINILPPDQLDAVVVQPNRTAAAYPASATIVDLFDAWVSRQADAPAVLAPHHSDLWLTYGALAARAQAVAAALQHDLHVAPGSRVAVYLRPSVDAVVAVLGVLKAGCTYVPIDPRYPQERVQFILNDSGVKAVLALKDDAAALATVACPLVAVESLAAEDARPVQRSSSPDDVAYVIYTSGSTGLPKGCLVTHRNVVRLLVNDRFDFSFGPADVWVMAHSLSFDFSVWEMYGALLHGGRLLMPSRDAVQDVTQFRDLLSRHRVTVLNQTPLAFYNLVAVEDATTDHTLGDHLRYVIFGGDRLDTSKLQPWVRHYPAERVALVNMYGITETTVHVTYCRLTSEQIQAPAGLPAVALAKVGRSPVGRPLPETTVYVCDRHLNPQPIGAPGEMLVGGSGVCLGYLDRPELTDTRFIPDTFSGSGRLYRSGDLAFRDESGALNFVGRNDHQVKIRGHRIEPAEVERALREVPGVEQAAVVVEQGAAGNELSALVTGSVDAEVVRASLSERVPDYLVPSSIVVCAALPLTAHGKLDVAAMRALRVTQAAATASFFEAPVGEREELLAGIWSDVIGVERVGRHDRFISLGGDSIKSIQILARLRARGLNVDLKDLFRYPTVAELAPQLKERRASAAVVANGPFVPTPIQRRFFEEHPVDSEHYNHAVLLRFDAQADMARLRTALQALIDTHAGLRQRFEQTAEGWMGRFADAGDPVPFVVEDLRDDREPLAAMKRLSAREQTGFRFDDGPLFRAALYRLPDADRLLLVAHHLIVDGVTWQIVLEDLAAALNGAALPEPTDSYAAWSAALQQLAADPGILSELPYWQAMESKDEPLPVTLGEAGLYLDAAEELIEWTAQQTGDLLRRAPAAYQTNAGELLLAAVARALGQWTGERRVLVALEGHGRDVAPTVDTSRTAGWFTALYPFMLDLDDRPVGRRIRQLKEDLRRVPNGGAGCGVLRYLSSAPGTDQLRARPRISFNYLGEFRTHASGSGFSLCSDAIAPSVSPTGPRPFALEIAAIVVEDRLRLSLTYAAAHLERARVRELRAALDDELQRVVAHCLTLDAPELTPADLTHKGLTLDELDELFDDD